MDKKDKELSYVGFIKKHPHDDYSIIRIAFSNIGEAEFTDVNINNMFGFAADVCIKLFANIKEYF